MYLVYSLSTVLLSLFFVVAKSQVQAVVDISDRVSERVSLGVFRHGWARIEEGSDVFFINAKGEKFRFQNPNDVTIGTYHAIEYERGLEETPHLLPRNVILMERNGLMGILNPKGEVMVPAEYTHIDKQYNTFWTLYQDNGKSFYLADGTILPFFEDVGYLDGEHFDVKKGDAWGIYRKSDGRIITKNTYEGFDYCGACGSAAPYMYAKKNGKWGIIDWAENVLVPFEYDHEHRSMRRDNWVASFSKNGEQVIVHIPTQRVFDASETDTELIANMLVTKRNGKYGAFDNEGQLAVPFEYDNIEAPNQNYYLGYYGDYLIVEKDGRKGVIRSDGTVIIPVEYEKVLVYDDYFAVTVADRTALITAGEMAPLIEIEHGDITHINDYFYSSGSDGRAIFRIKQQAYYGLYFADSAIYIEPEFYDISISEAGDFNGGRIIVADRQGRKKLFSQSGKPLLPFEVVDFDVFDELGEPLLAVNVGGKWGLYDIRREKEIVPPACDRFFKVLGDSGSRFIRGAIEENGEPDRYVLYDTDGTKVFDDVMVSTIEPIDDRYYLVGMEETGAVEYAVFDGGAKTLEPLDYRFAALSGAPGLVVVSNDKITGKLYDVGSKKELGRDYHISMFSGETRAEDDGYAADGTWGLSPFSEGLSRVFVNDGVGFMDEQEKVVVEPRFAQVVLVGERYAVVRERAVDNGAYEPAYFIDRMHGKRIFPKLYFVDDMLLYNLDDYDLDGIAILVRQKSDSARFSGYSSYFALGDLETGELLTDALYDEIMPLYDASYLILIQTVDSGDGEGEQKKYGLAKKNGEILFEPRFDDIYYNDDTSDSIFPLLVRLEGIWTYINADGSCLPITGDYALR